MKSKHLRLPEPTAKDFEVLCALLGISERQAGELAVRQWIQRNRNQVSLETWTEARGSAAPVNREKKRLPSQHARRAILAFEALKQDPVPVPE
jgi:hypothetical protein